MLNHTVITFKVVELRLDTQSYRRFNFLDFTCV